METIYPQTQGINKPFLQPLYIDLQSDDDYKPVGIHLGIRTGINYLLDYFHQLKRIGVNHIAINLRFNMDNIQKTMETLAQKVLVHFHN